MKNTIIIGSILFVAGVLIGFGGDRAYMKRKAASAMQQSAEQQQNVENTGVATAGAGVGSDQENTQQSAGPSPVTVTPQSSGANSVSVEDQKPGNEVAIQSVTLGTEGWVVVHDDSSGKPGHILGAHRFNSGTHPNQVVELLKETEEGKVYYAMLHADDGDRQFDYRADLPIKDDAGNPVMMRFVATAKTSQ